MADDPSLTETVAHSSLPRISSTSSADEGRFIAGTLLGGRYRIIGLLGCGGMGEVYRATGLTLGQSVALKFLPAEAAGNNRLLERFAGEVRVARQVSHPNVCRVYDLGEVDGAPFISMEYVDSEDLASLLPRIGRLPADKAIETARKICAGLAAAHDRGIIHRDLKPQNIMMNKRGDVVIMDFGLAAIADQLSGPEARNGTPAYMSPEQLKGAEVTARSDIFALGLVLYELFTGKRPYDAKTVPQLLSLHRLKKDWLAAIAASVLFTLTQGEVVTDPNWLKVAAIYVGLYAILMFVLLRVGLVATMSAVFFLNALNRICLGSDWKAWWAPSGFATIFLLIAMVSYAFWRSQGARDRDAVSF